MKNTRLESSKHDFRCYVVFAGYFIKYDSHTFLYPRYKTQQYISKLADGDTDAPRVLKIYDYFTPEHKTAYLIMEYIKAESIPVRDATEKAFGWILSRSRSKDISFSAEQLVFAQSDMDESNFFVDTEENMCILDFENVGLTPQSFASYTMSTSDSPFASDVTKHSGRSASLNLYSMGRTGVILMMSTDTTLGTAGPCDFEPQFKR